jgi:predicted alpha-1,2-mannosidase
MKVGISFISIAKAKDNLKNEITHWDFQKTYQQSVDAWNSYLSRIKVETKDENLRKMLYTGIYHSLLMPTNRTGENPLWKSNMPYYDDYYAIWDTYRTLHPLLTLVWQNRQTDIVNSMIDIYKYDNYMPDARSGNVNGRTQGGSNCDMVIADAFVKGLTGIDYETAYKAMLKNAEVPPGDNEQKEGRGGIADYNSIGYVSTAFERSASRTIEYGNCDWAIAQVAKGLGKTADYEKYKQRASNWKNLWNNSISYKSINGFVMPKNCQGVWATDLDVTTFGSWAGYYYESNPWEYTLSIPQDVTGLMELCGGKEKFAQRLDTTFLAKCNSDWGDCLYNVSNEPGFLTPSLYHWAGMPYKTNELIRKIIKRSYNTSKSGIPGNDDGGAMSSWLAFHLMGIYPNAGQNVYLITAPHFTTTAITMDNGKVFEIIAKKLSDKNLYIQSATLNGTPLNQAWFKHTDINNGAKLELIMGAKPSNWGTNNPPPSMSDK